MWKYSRAYKMKLWPFRFRWLVLLIMSVSASAQTWTKILDGVILSNIGFVDDNQASLLVEYQPNPPINEEQLVRIDVNGTVLEEYNAPTSVRLITVNPLDGSEFYIAGQGGLNLPQCIYRTQDNGESWENIGESLFPSGDFFLSGLWVYPNDPGYLFAGRSGFAGTPINFRSDDKGDSWESITSLYFGQSLTFMLPSKTVSNRILATTLGMTKSSVCVLDHLGDSVYSIIDTSNFPLPVFPEPEAPAMDAIYNWGSDTTETYLVGAHWANSEGVTNYLLTLDAGETSNVWRILRTINYDSLYLGFLVAKGNQIYLPVFDGHHGQYGHLGIYGTINGGEAWTFMDTTGLGCIDFGLEGSLIVDPREDNPNLYYLTPVGLFSATLPLSPSEDWVSLDRLNFPNEPPEPQDFGISSVYPNPVNHEVTISFNTNYSGPVQFEIFDIQGRRLTNQPGQVTQNQLRLDLSGLASGVYFVRMHLENKMLMTQFTLNK